MENPGFTALLEERMQAATVAARAQVDAKIRDRYERDAAVMIIDMSGFSRITQDEGIVHFLELIHRMQGLVLPIIEAAAGGHVVKTEADNVYAMFDSVQAAIDTAVALQEACRTAFDGKPVNDAVRLSIGIAWGPLLDLDGHEYYGDPVNLASKLGEDLASAGDIYVTADAANGTTLPAGWRSEPKRERMSNIDIEFLALVRD
ncbi:MAG: adenylate/guanylate cyclase domain-containing protein [Myxococcota bacterium]